MMEKLRKLLLFPLALLLLPIAKIYWWNKRRKRLTTNDDRLISVVFDAKPPRGVSRIDHSKEFSLWLSKGVNHIWHTRGSLPKDFLIVTSPSLLSFFTVHPSFEMPTVHQHHVRGSYQGHPLYIDAGIEYNTMNYVSGSKRLGTLRVTNS